MTTRKRRTREEIEHRDRIILAADQMVRAELGNNWTWIHSERKKQLLNFLDNTPPEWVALFDNQRKGTNS
jgi:hypothetical protein